MRFQENGQLAKQILADLSEELDEGRESRRDHKPHVSELIYCLTRSWYQRFKPLPATPNESMMFLLGVRLETVLLKQHKLSRHGEVEGILYEVDSLDYAGFGEMKSTRISSNRNVEDLPITWQKQVLSYMYCLGVTEATLAILHLMGSYKPPFPELKVWNVDAEQEEIDSNWAWLQARKDRFEAGIKEGTPPRQFTFNEPWECDFCRYKLICEANEAVERLRGQQASS